MNTNWQNDLLQHKDKERLARKILGVTKNSNKLIIKKAFWLLAMKYHPDKSSKEKDTEQQFINIVNAYNFLVKKDSKGWNPTKLNCKKENDGIGKFTSSKWGYFCWWQDMFG